MQRSPCLTSGPNNTACPRAGEDKNNPVCENCELKYSYWKGDDCPCFSEVFQSEGHGGFSLEDLSKNYKPMEERVGPCEFYVKQKCIEAGITVEDLRGLKRIRKITAVRRKIIQELSGKGMKDKEICKILDISEFGVWYHLNRTPTEDKRRKNEKEKAYK